MALPYCFTNNSIRLLFICACLVACQPKPPQEINLQVSETTKANQLFDEIFEQDLARNPELQTQLGRKEGLDQWNNLTAEFAAGSLTQNKHHLTRLTELNYNELDPPTALSFDLLKQTLEQRIADYQWRLYNYPVNQMFGTHTKVADTLINQHRITDLYSANAYIARLNAVPELFEQLIEGINSRTDANIIPPKFVFPYVIQDSRNLIKGEPFTDGERNAIWLDFNNKLQALSDQDSSFDKQTQERLLADAKTALLDSVKPAYENLITHLTTLEQLANTDDGVWKWHNGALFYQNALQRTTTTSLGSDEIHQIGLDEVARIHGEMNTIKEAIKFDGDLASFMTYMRESDDFYYPNTAAGKQRYLDEATALINTMKSKLDDMFITQPKADLAVKAVEAFREKSAGKAFYSRPSEDGSRPGLYYANLYDMKSMPIYQMEALAYHEGLPGHHMQIAIAQELSDVPKFRKYGSYTAYIEGWGLYSEMLPKEYGLYSDPYSDFGRLAMELWRACRLVVDTGIHSQKWTRQQSINYYVNNPPNSEWDAIKMVERHIVMPSQATAYKIGMLKILELRDKSRAALGNNFDIRYFHDEILKYGALPLNVLEQKIDNWIEQHTAVD